MKVIYAITVRWIVSPVNPPLIDAVLSQAGDWIRFNAETWLVASTTHPTEIRNLLLKHLSPQDNWLILPINPYMAADGWAPEWVWEWLRNQVAGIAPPPPPPQPLPPRATGGLDSALELLMRPKT